VLLAGHSTLFAERACAIFSRMSLRRWLAFLEGIHAFAEDIISQQWLELASVHDIGRPSEEVVYVELQPGVAEDADGPIRIEINEDIDVASRMSLAADKRPEHRGVLDTEPAQLDFMSLECIEDGL
jgi:hypothetical protein